MKQPTGQIQTVDTSYEQPIQSIQKLDRTRLWVASQESLTSMGKPHLPPKPQIQPQEPQNNSIPYGYENVLPISQRYVIFRNTSKCNYFFVNLQKKKEPILEALNFDFT